MKITSRENFEKELTDAKLKELITPKSTDPASFNSACESFKFVCNEIGKLMGMREGYFKGGFDEMILCTEYVNNQDKDTPQGMKNVVQMLVLVSAWNGANSLCTYEAKKLGIGQPDWWYQCWNINPEDIFEPDNGSVKHVWPMNQEDATSSAQYRVHSNDLT